MRTAIKNILVLVASIMMTSCIKDIDIEPIPRTVDKTFTIQNSIKQVQSFFKFYENAVLEVSTASPSSWDLAFESAGAGNRVLISWARSSKVVASGKFDFSDITQDLILEFIESSNDWIFNDPSFIDTPDSLCLNNWENGEIYIHKRGSEKDNYYAIQFISRTPESYTIKFASAQALEDVTETTIPRSTGHNYVSFSYLDNSLIEVEPMSMDWDIISTPYTSYWETDDPGVFAPFFVSGILINNEAGVRIAHVFDPGIEFSDIDLSFTESYEFTALKGAIGANWKILGEVNTSGFYTMDPDKKYLLRKFDIETNREMFFKLQIVDYKLDGEDHHPTIEFKYLGAK